MNRLLVAAAATIALVLSAGTAAHASTPGPGATADRPQDPSVAVQCWSEWAPEPQYSASNHTLHWGHKTVCDKVGQFSVTVDLYSIVGEGERERSVRRETAVNNQVASEAYAGDFYFCDGTASTRWYIVAYTKFNGKTFIPYPSPSPTHTLPCGA